MRTRRLLLAATALTTAISCGGKKKESIIHANPKGSVYDKGPPDAGSPDDAAAGPPDVAPIPPPANPKGAFYDGGLGPPGALKD